MFYKIRPAVALCAMLLIVIAMACTPAPTPAPPTAAPAATTAPTTAPQPTATLSLLDAAKKEGKVSIYTSLNADEFEPIVKEFNKKHPDIKVDFWRGGSEDVTAKALTEYRANTFLVDVLETTDVNVVQLLSAGVLGQYKSTELKAYPAGVADPDGYYSTDRVNLTVIAYNTNLVKKEDAPKKLEDLLDPKWAGGKIAIEADDFPLMAYTAKVWGDAKANDFWTKLAAQKPRVVKGHTELANFLVAGEFTVSPTVYAHRIESQKAKKAPVEWVKTDPVYGFPHVIAIAKNVVHPNAAKLWIDWFLSEAGQQAIANVGRYPVRPGVKTNPEGLLQGLNIFYGDPKSLLKADDIQKQYYTLFGIK